MATGTRILVVANRTVGAPALAEELRRLADGRDVSFTVLAPCPVREREAARERLDEAVVELRVMGLHAKGVLGAETPLTAVEEEYDNARYDEIVVATLEAGASQWLAGGLPGQIERRTHAVVHHVTVPEAQAAPPPPPPAEHRGLLEGLLSELHVETNKTGHPYG